MMKANSEAFLSLLTERPVMAMSVHLGLDLLGLPPERTCVQPIYAPGAEHQAWAK